MDKNPLHMTPEEIVVEIHEHRDVIRRKAIRIYELSRALYARTRRLPTDESTSPRILFANSWTRLAGAIEQGLKRTVSIDRVVRNHLKPAQEVEQTPVQKPKPKPEAPKVVYDDDLDSLYGTEVVNHALQQ